MELVTRLGVDEETLSKQTLEKAIRKAVSGQMLVELGAPKVPEGASPQSRMERYKYIDQSNVCAKITELHVGEDGKVYGTVVPHGAKGKLLKQLLKGGLGDQLTFSTRAVGGIGQQPELITFDLTKF